VFKRASNAQCIWQDRSTIVATLDSLTTLNIGNDASSTSTINTITHFKLLGDSLDVIASNTIRAKCQSSDVSKCLAWKTVVPSGSIKVRGPDVVTPPTVVIAAPSVVSKCDNIKIDVSYSKGSAGRQWIGWKFSILDVSSEIPRNLTTAISYLNSHFSISPPVVLPAGLLPIGSYSITLSLSNFLGASSQTSHDLLIVSLAIPSVSISGTALRQIYRKDAIKLQAKAYVMGCSVEGNTYNTKIILIIFLN